MTFCQAVSDGTRLNAWKITPTRSRRSTASSCSLIFVMSCPAMRTAPDCGRSRPEAHCSRVLLPEPDGPITAVKAPLRNATLTRRRATDSVLPLPYVLDTFSRTTA
ncbi:hypothetical protein SAMN05421833_10635 [Microbispora rosea]|uniref:Uncharacterized protein n=1 Tax=Microbispora rosea TaxID=58117 RepID=A0A1N6Y840_9ACTN|nr:hypothetical protein SAMN05421833_10635 [Microbispora rosea]